MDHYLEVNQTWNGPTGEGVASQARTSSPSRDPFQELGEGVEGDLAVLSLVDSIPRVADLTDLPPLPGGGMRGVTTIHGEPARMVRAAKDSRHGVAFRVPIRANIKGWMRDDYDYRLTLVDDDGTLVVDELTVIRRPGGPAVQAQALRKVRLGEVVQAVAAAASEPVVLSDDGEWIRDGEGGWGMATGAPRRGADPFYDQAVPEGHSRTRALEDVGTHRPGSQKSPEHHRRVAELYRQALAEGRSVNRWIARAMAGPEGPPATSTVGRWIGEARKKDDPATGERYLGPAPGEGAKGEL